MIKADGISDDAVNSTQNTKIEDLEADDDQQFETDLVIVDDSEEDEVDEEDSNSTNTTDDRPPVNARLLADEANIGVVYDVDGYQADDDTFVDGVIVSEPSMAEGITVPEDNVAGKPSGADDYTFYYVAAAFALLGMAVGAFFACRSKSAPYSHNNGGPQNGIDMQDMRDTTMTQVI
jgi:hypothetical protein